MNNGLTNENEVNKLHLQLQNILNCLKTLGRCSTMKVRLQLANAAFMGRLNYMLPTYTNLTSLQYSKIHTVMMKMARWTKGEYVPRERNSSILKTLNWLPLKQMIIVSGIKVMHNIIQTKESTSLYEMLRIPRRKTAQIGMKRYPKKMKLSKKMMYLTLKEYNKLPEKLKLTEKDKFKSRVNTYFRGRFRKEPG